MKRLPFITKTILILSFVSLLTDIASEMLYPIMPLYLSQIGFSIAFIGVLEGVAEAIAGLSKGFFGYLSDSKRKRKPFVVAGYSLSALAKPMIGVWTNPIWILCARSVERLGKGIRTGARDAMLSDETEPANKGRVFGFHRAFDTLGAALGPIVALIYLSFHPSQYRPLFFIALIPGIFAIGLSFLLRERPAAQAVDSPRTSYNPFHYLKYWKVAPKTFRRLVVGLLAFALFNSSDVFLLLIMKARGLNDQFIIVIYIFYNLVYAFASYPLGALGDSIGLKKTLLLGLLIFTGVYGGMAFANSTAVFFILFLFYGLYAAATEGISKAWISNIVAPTDVATAIGFYTSFQSICALLASSIAGWLWTVGGPKLVFGLTSIATLCTLFYIAFAVPHEMVTKRSQV
jgi:MFS family permease